MRSITILFCLLLFSSCDTSVSTEKVSLDEEFELKIGQEKVLEDAKITVGFSEIMEDSRCPRQVRCTWAGNAKIMLRFGQSDLILNTYSEPKQQQASGYIVHLVKLEPYPEYPEAIDENEYRATILVQQAD